MGQDWLRLGRAVQQVGGERGGQRQAGGRRTQSRPPHALPDHTTTQLHQRQRLGWNHEHDITQTTRRHMKCNHDSAYKQDGTM